MFKLYLLLLITTFTFSITVTVQLVLPQVNSLSPSQQQDIRNIRIAVDTQSESISASDKNSFVINNLNEGTHLVQVRSKLFLYELLNIQVKKDQNIYYTVHPWTRKRLTKLDKPRVKPLQRINYFQKQSGFNISSLLGSWHVLFVLFGVFMMLCYNYVMPKMQEAAVAPSSPNQR